MRCEDRGADLMTLGSHGYRGFTRFLPGSVSYAVASHAPCSVEIVRKPMLSYMTPRATLRQEEKHEYR
jgi:nucleotide-binding universal stress UspA family protein